jgi:hypothetical protein
MWSESRGLLRRWPEVEARGLGGAIASYMRKGHTYYRARYELAYRFGSRDFATPVSASTAAGSRDSAAREVERYAPGTMHTIRVNPDNPHEIRVDARGIGFWVLPGLFSGIGLLLAGTGLWAWKRSLRAPVPTKRLRAGEQDVRQLSRKGEILSIAALSSVGLTMLGLSAWQASGWVEVSSWRETTAFVQQSVFERSLDSTGTERYTLRAEVRIEENGRPLTTALSVGPEKQYAWVRNLADRCQRGSTVGVRYKPGDPAHAFLEGGSSRSAAILAVASGLLGVSFTVAGAAALRNARKQPA